MEYLGMIIGQGFVRMDPAKLSAIKDWQPPSSVKGVCSFLGFANFYRKFIPNFSNVIAPIVLLTHKNHPWSLLQSFFLIIPSYFSLILVVYLLGEVDVITPILLIFSFAPYLPFVSLTFLQT